MLLFGVSGCISPETIKSDCHSLLFKFGAWNGNGATVLKQHILKTLDLLKDILLSPIMLLFFSSLHHTPLHDHARFPIKARVQYNLQMHLTPLSARDTRSILTLFH